MSNDRYVQKLQKTADKLLGGIEPGDVNEWWRIIYPHLEAHADRLFQTGNPTHSGWYIVQAPHLSKIVVRYYDKVAGMWWTDLGRGNGKDGWMSSPSGEYVWIGPIAGPDDAKPQIEERKRLSTPADAGREEQ